MARVLIGNWAKLTMALGREGQRTFDRELRQTLGKSGEIVRKEIIGVLSRSGRGVAFSGKSAPGVPTARLPFKRLSEWGFLSRRSSKGILAKIGKAKTKRAKKRNREKLKAQAKAAKPLLDTGEMMRAVRVHRLDRNNVFIGIKRNFKRGTKTANLALIHEFGAVARLPKGRGTAIIPARPFIRPGWKVALPKVLEFISRSYFRTATLNFGGLA